MFTRRRGTTDDERELVLDAYPVLARVVESRKRPPPGGEVEVHLAIHARFYRTVPAGALRGRLVDRLAKQLGFPLDDKSMKVFRERIRPFLAESLSRKPLVAEIGGREFELGNTGRDGHLRTSLSLKLPREEVATASIHLHSGCGEASAPAVTVIDIPSRGTSVISDVDDTIRVSNVHETRELLEGTFVGRYRAVPGMPEVYRRWATPETRFHFVSATPWQLYRPLSEFLEVSGYPPATLHLKQFRLKDRSAVNMLRPSHLVKRRTLAELVSGFPLRRFVLVGDSTEGDPIIYSELQTAFPGRIAQILIRDTGMNPGLNRVLDSLTEKQRATWQIFTSPGQIVDRFLDVDHGV